MINQRKSIVISLVLGVVLPAVLLSAIGNKNVDNHNLDQTEGTTAQQHVADSVNMISVLMNDGSVCQMEMDDYLLCVVLREMPPEFEVEALKAQAVVARTYTLKRQRAGKKHEDADVCANSECCQGYLSVQRYLENGGEQHLVEKVRSTITDTKNQVLLYGGELIDATYFSCSGGSTEDAKAVWGADVPYLQATDSPGEEGAAHYTDTVKFSATEFCDLLGVRAPDQSGVRIDNIVYTEGGGIDSIQICGKVFKGTEVRKLLGLRSTSFVLTAVGDGIIITTKGFGHRVGMSQYGAEAMAQRGSTYEQILKHYYDGVVLSELAK